MERSLRSTDLVAHRLPVLISRVIAICMLLVVLPALSPGVAAPAEDPKKVLIFSGTDPNLPSVVVVSEILRSTLEKAGPGRVQFYSEALDNHRIPEAKYEEEMAKVLQRKYEGERLDLIFTLSSPALKFLVKHKDELFSTTPKIFLHTNAHEIEGFDFGQNVTGVQGRIELRPSVDLALSLHPGSRRVVVVTGNSNLDKFWEERARREFTSYGGSIEFTYLTNLTIEELRRELASLPQNTIVLFLNFLLDRNGNGYSLPEAVSLVAPSSSAPIYVAIQSAFRPGVVGGRMISYETLGKAAADLGVRVLAGERPQDIPPQTVPSAAIFDWRELRRWVIDESRLPADSMVRYREPTFWEQYKWRIVGAVSLIILQTLLIVGLLINRARRRQAEEASKTSEKRYRNVVDTQTELICRFLPDSTLTFVNDAYCRHFGKTRDQLIGTKFTHLMPDHAREAALSHIASLIENPRAETYEHQVVLPNGGMGWQQWTDNVVGSRNGHGVELQGIGRDITERRQAEDALRVSENEFRNVVNSPMVMLWMSGTDKLCTYFNQGWLDFTGRALEEELGDGWAQGVHKDDYADCLETYGAAFEGREPFKLEYRLRRADGVYRWIYDSGTPRFSLEGKFLGYIGSCMDISDRKAAEEALQKAHEEVSKLKNQLQEENIYLQEEIRLTHNVDEIIGASDATKYVLYKIEQVAETDATVLILGETGTGKELVARGIHSESLRKDRPLVKVNCAALSASLIESELFGHEKGAFTGASARQVGRFELADGATIFLDEIGELPLELQPKLLRVIQEGEIERLGSSKTRKVDVRIIAATNRNLKLEVEKGTFREDLWYRLNVFPITVPPLRQRKEDIPLLVEHFVALFSKKVGREITSISAATLKKLQDHSWPGNVRELANVMERGVITGQGAVLHIADQFARSKGAELDSHHTLEEVEIEHITHILNQTGWRIEGPSGAAKILGINPSTLRTRMQKLGIHKSIRSLSAGSETTR